LLPHCFNGHDAVADSKASFVAEVAALFFFAARLNASLTLRSGYQFGKTFESAQFDWMLNGIMSPFGLKRHADNVILNHHESPLLLPRVRFSSVGY